MFNDLQGDSYGLSGGGSSPESGSAWGPSYRRQSPGRMQTPAFRGPSNGAPATNGFSDPTSTYSPSYAGTNGNGSGGSPNDPVTQDRQARQTYSSLKSAGHDVKWQGDQLLVDGRPYVLGNGSHDLNTLRSTPAGQAPTFGPDARTASPSSSLQDVYNSVRGKGAPGASSLDDLRAAYAAAGYNVDRPTYNGVPSGNELTVNGQKLKFTVGDVGTPGASWYDWGTNDGGGGGYAGGDSMMGMPSYSDVSALGFPQYSYQAPAAPWGDSGPAVYNPGAISFDDIPNFTPESLLAQMRNGRSASSLDSLVSDIQEHPYSLDEHAVDSMKAGMKDTLAEQQQFEDQNLKGMGASYGIGDSPWLASERLASDRSKNQAIASGAQNIDIQAAQTRAADKRAAAQVGTTYQGQRSQQVMNTVNAGLDRARVTGDRMQLRESVAQAAASSRQSAQKIMADWLMQNAGMKLDYDKLNSSNALELENVMMKVQQLKQQEREFGAGYGLDVSKEQHAEDQDAWQRSYVENNP